MTVVTTSTAATAAAYSNQRKVDRCQNGVLWAMFWDGTSNTSSSMHFRYSTDSGATWTDGGGFGFAGTGTTHTPNGSLFIDLDDYAHVAYKDRHDGTLKYRRGTPNGARTSWTWSAPTDVFAGLNQGDHPDLVAHREGAGWKVHIVCTRIQATACSTTYSRIGVASDGTLTEEAEASGLSPSYSHTLGTYPSIDFNHTGDGKTIAGGTPHLYVAWSAGAAGSGNGIRFKKATYSGGAWTWGTEREIDSTRYLAAPDRWLNCLFDGTRVIMPGFLEPASSVVLYERDAADTTTTTNVLVATGSNNNYFFQGSASYDSSGNVYYVGRDYDGTQHIDYAKWTRSTATLGSHVLVDSTNVSNATYVASTKRGYSGGRIEFAYVDGTASPYSVTYGSVVLNVPPNAPILTSPTDGQGIGWNISNRFDWDFSDPDPGDSQSAYQVDYWELDAPGGSRVGSVVSTGKLSSPLTYHDFPAATFASGTSYEWQVTTWDAQGTVGPASASGFFTAGTAPTTPTITDPVSGSTVSFAHVVTWSAPDQDAYELRRVADNAGEPDTATIYFDTGEVVSAAARSRTVEFPVEGRFEHVQLRVKNDGLWSAWASSRVLASYAPPPVPTLDFTSDEGALIVGITNPAPGVGEPDAVYNDVYVDDGAGWERRVTLLAPSTAWTYHLPVSGRDYAANVAVIAFSDDGSPSSTPPT